MSMEVETLVAISVMMAVFSVIAVVGSSIVLGVGFVRLRAGFDVISKQAGFFSDAIYRLEEKIDAVDVKAGGVSRSISNMDGNISSIIEQNNYFNNSIAKIEEKVDQYVGIGVVNISKAEQVITQAGVLADKMSRTNNSFDLQDIVTAGSLAKHTYMPAVDAPERDLLYN